MHRREVLEFGMMATTHVLFPGIIASFISGCEKPESGTLFFTTGELTLLKDLIDVILPATGTASASQSGTHLFIDQVFAKCLEPEQQALIREGLGSVKKRFEASKDKIGLLNEIDEKAYRGDKEMRWFILIKQYTLIGFFTSKEGTTQASNYVPIPGEYKGEIPSNDQTLNYGLTALRYYL
ncbi:MAG: gluconate 2-dehydrogenase subunit 3 family protein [Saprospiraceae bacterium]|nr:gluconate 2-dehydrogenase subunit 3 family protein [Saprospiraceae bacterium]